MAEADAGGRLNLTVPVSLSVSLSPAREIPTQHNHNHRDLLPPKTTKSTARVQIEHRRCLPLSQTHPQHHSMLYPATRSPPSAATDPRTPKPVRNLKFPLMSSIPVKLTSRDPFPLDFTQVLMICKGGCGRCSSRGRRRS